MNLVQNPLLHTVRLILEWVSKRPADWPFIFFLPLMAGIYLASQESLGGRPKSLARPAVLVVTILTLTATFRTLLSYMWMNSMCNGWATLFAITSWLYYNGQPLYSSAHSETPYVMQYGPYGFILVGFVQHWLGPSLFASKLAPFLATVVSFVFIYLALRTRVEWLFALALTALASTLLLPFDPLEFWPRPDPFIVLATSGGLWASTLRGKAGPILLGASIGFAVDLKIYSFVFFLMMIVVAWRNHKSIILWMAAVLAAVLTAALPFTWADISAKDYLEILHKETAIRILTGFALQYAEWSIIFLIIAFAPLIAHRWKEGEAVQSFRKNLDLMVSFALSFVAVGYPSSHEGAGPHHVMPLIGPVVYLTAHLYSDVSPKGFFQRSLSWPGTSMTLSVVLLAESYAMLFSLNPPATFQENFLFLKQAKSFPAYDAMVKERIVDCGQIFAQKMPCVLLFTATSLSSQEDEFYRAILVFNGMPMGFSPAGCADHEYLNNYKPNFDAYMAELKSKTNKPVIWICPKGEEPFSLHSLYGNGDRLFSEEFVNDFRQRFQLTGQSAFFDIYEEKPQR